MASLSLSHFDLELLFLSFVFFGCCFSLSLLSLLFLGFLCEEGNVLIGEVSLLWNRLRLILCLVTRFKNSSS